MANVITADWDEMLFEQREKSYGAYLLRKQYPDTLLKVTLFTILISGLIPICQSSLILSLFGIKNQETIGERVKYNLPITLSPPPTKLEKPIELPPPTMLPEPKITTVVFQIPEPSPKEELSEKHTITDVKELQAAPLIGLKEITGESNVFEEFEICGAKKYAIAPFEQEDKHLLKIAERDKLAEK